MPDFKMCSGFDCKVKHICYRYRAIPSSVLQEWFDNKPNPKKDGCFKRIEPFHKIREVGDIELKVNDSKVEIS